MLRVNLCFALRESLTRLVGRVCGSLRGRVLPDIPQIPRAGSLLIPQLKLTLKGKKTSFERTRKVPASDKPGKRGWKAPLAVTGTVLGGGGLYWRHRKKKKVQDRLEKSASG